MKAYILLASLLLSQWSFSQESSYTLSGKVGVVNSPAKVYLFLKGSRMVKDSSELKKGTFRFKGKYAEPMRASLLLDHKGQGLNDLKKNRPLDLLELYIEKGVIVITSRDSLKNAEVKGGAVNADFTALKVQRKPIDEMMSQLIMQYSVLVKTQAAKLALDLLEQKYDSISDIDLKNQTDFIRKHSKSVVSLDILQQIGASSLEAPEIEELFNGLDPSLRATPQGKIYAAEIAKNKIVGIGAIAPDFELPNVAGKMVKLSNYRGKYVLIDFWASWCNPCRQENPNVVKAYQTFKDRNFTVLGVSLDMENKKEAWIKAIADDQLEWEQVSDLKGWDNAAAKLYMIRSIPQNVLLDPQGKIIAKNLRGEQLQTKLNELLKQ